MALWKNCRMDTLFYAAKADTNESCEVRIDEREIVVTYAKDDGVTYTGRNDDTGHFELHANRYSGRASLHMFPGGSVLEGYWLETPIGGAEERGMWRIVLA